MTFFCRKKRQAADETSTEVETTTASAADPSADTNSQVINADRYGGRQ